MTGKNNRSYPYLVYLPAARRLYGEKDKPQHRELHALLFATSVWVL